MKSITEQNIRRRYRRVSRPVLFQPPLAQPRGRDAGMFQPPAKLPCEKLRPKRTKMNGSEHSTLVVQLSLDAGNLSLHPILNDEQIGLHAFERAQRLYQGRG